MTADGRPSITQPSPRGMRHYGFVCRLRRHARGAPDMKAYAVAGVVVDFCNTCSRDSLATLDLDAIRARRAE